MLNWIKMTNFPKQFVQNSNLFSLFTSPAIKIKKKLLKHKGGTSARFLMYLVYNASTNMFIDKSALSG